MDGEQYKFYRIANVNDMPEGERLIFEINGLAIVLFNVNGEFLATGDLCSHEKVP